MVRLRINISYYGHVRGHIGGRRSILHTIVRGSFVRSHRLCIDSLGRQVTLLCHTTGEFTSASSDRYRKRRRSLAVLSSVVVDKLRPRLN